MTFTAVLCLFTSIFSTALSPKFYQICSVIPAMNDLMYFRFVFREQ